jgi:hypothetical protein
MDIKDIELVYAPVIALDMDGRLIVKGHVMSHEEETNFRASLNGYKESYARNVLR